MCRVNTQSLSYPGRPMASPLPPVIVIGPHCAALLVVLGTQPGADCELEDEELAGRGEEQWCCSRFHESSTLDHTFVPLGERRGEEPQKLFWWLLWVVWTFFYEHLVWHRHTHTSVVFINCYCILKVCNRFTRVETNNQDNLTKCKTSGSWFGGPLEV